jgi:hypothetical protein
MTISDKTLIRKYGGTLEEAKAKWREEMRANGSEGGKVRGRKGLRVLQDNNPEKFREIVNQGLAARRKK